MRSGCGMSLYEHQHPWNFKNDALIVQNGARCSKEKKRLKSSWNLENGTDNAPDFVTRLTPSTTTYKIQNKGQYLETCIQKSSAKGRNQAKKWFGATRRVESHQTDRKPITFWESYPRALPSSWVFCLSSSWEVGWAQPRFDVKGRF
jgi:hypothetical protein